MRISGFTYVRNGFTYGYPFIESIKSLLPIVDEFVVVVGDSTDGTREAIENIDDKRIIIIDSVWDENLRVSGKIFAMQSNLGIANITGDWAIHIQVDEVLHESAGKKLLDFIELANTMDTVEGLLFPFYHFWGDYDHIWNTRRSHRCEIRAFKNTGKVRSYKDSQGFRKYASEASYQAGEKGEKLRVLYTGIPFYHYSYSRNPKLMQKKTKYFRRFWHNDELIEATTKSLDFDYNQIDKVVRFSGEHPLAMKAIIEKKDWNFNYDPSKSTMTFKDKILNTFEDWFGVRLFEYKNYKVVKSPRAPKRPGSW